MNVASNDSVHMMYIRSLTIKFLAGLLLSLSSQQQQQQEIVEQAAVAGLSTNIVINCGLGRQDEAPFWVINGSIYELFSIPQSFLSNGVPVVPTVDSFERLAIPQVTTDLNRTVFQCDLFGDNGVIIEGQRTKLIVTSSKWLVYSLLWSATHVYHCRWS